MVGGEMVLEDILSNVNYNIEKIVEELRNRINSIPEINEVIDRNNNIIYQYSEKNFCIIKVKKDNLVIDFKADKILEDPINFSWKIRRNKNENFDRRMHIKNIFDIDMAYGLIFQSYKYMMNKNKTHNKNHIHNNKNHNNKNSRK